MFSLSEQARKEAQGLLLLENYPKCSQDLPPIENAWRGIRARLAATEPGHMESRGAFVTRLRAVVSWVNAHQAAYLRQLCNSQKARAAAVLTARPAGSRTQH